MQTIIKALRFLFSMKFALVILCLFVLVCVAGSVIPQGEIQAVYENSYPGWSGLILGTGLDDVFHSWWFIALTLLLWAGGQRCMGVAGRSACWGCLSGRRFSCLRVRPSVRGCCSSAAVCILCCCR